MKVLSRLAAIGSFGLLFACGAPDSDHSKGSQADHLEDDFGGPGGLLEFFETSSEGDVRNMLSEYDVGYVRYALSSTIDDCPQRFPSSDRNTWHDFNGEHYYIEASGRPNRAYTYLPPVTAAPRVSCQTTVGQWGDAENPSNDYDGGHLIGSQLGGWGGRANVVPQDTNFNRGNWVQLENRAALCRVLPSNRIYYYTRADYPNSTALVPNRFSMILENRSTGASVSLSFTNVDGGGPSGTSERQRGVSFLDSNGCR